MCLIIHGRCTRDMIQHPQYGTGTEMTHRQQMMWTCRETKGRFKEVSADKKQINDRCTHGLNESMCCKKTFSSFLIATFFFNLDNSCGSDNIIFRASVY